MKKILSLLLRMSILFNLSYITTNAADNNTAPEITKIDQLTEIQKIYDVIQDEYAYRLSKNNPNKQFTLGINELANKCKTINDLVIKDKITNANVLSFLKSDFLTMYHIHMVIYY